MHPYLAEQWIGRFATIPSYAFFLALAFTVAYVETLRRGIKAGLAPLHFERLFLITVVSSLTGAHFVHALFDSTSKTGLWAIWEGGYTFYGGMLAAVLALFLYCRWKQLVFLSYMDSIAPSALLGLAIGRLGCFAAGCCYGKPTLLPWGVTFTHPHSLTALRGVALHPVQLYESFVCLLLYLAIGNSGIKKTGRSFYLCVGAYAIARFALEFFRADTSRGFVLGGKLSASQFLSLCLIGLLAAIALKESLTSAD
jgi:phosphatidylglycerol---prolipoprotein diacylglyceryl transferase